MQVIYSKEAPEPIGPYSQAVLSGDTLYVSGQIAINPANDKLVLDDIENETHQVFSNISAVLKAADMNLKNVVKCSVFLKNMGNFPIINNIYAQYFTENFPARETVEVAGLPKNVNVEIAVVAVKKEGV